MIPIAKPYLTKEAKAAYDTILTGWITQGPRVAEFEQKFAAYTGAKLLWRSLIVQPLSPGHDCCRHRSGR